MKKTVSALLVLCMLFLCGCQTQPPVSDTTPMESEPKPADSYRFADESRFTYHNGKIYFISGYDWYANNLPIHAYDLATGTLISNTSAVKPHAQRGDSDNIWSDGNDLYRFCPIGGDTAYLFRIAPDFSSETIVWQPTDDWHESLYSDGYYYYSDSVVNEAEERVEYTLCRRNLETGEVTVLYEYNNQFSIWDVDDQYIYFRRPHGQGMYTLLRSPKDTIRFETMEYMFPNATSIITVDGGVFISSNGNKLLSYVDGSITNIDISLSAGLHLVGDHTIVSRHAELRSATRSTQCRPLSIFDIRTGESTLVCDSVVDFDVLEDRYICYWWADWQHHKWFVYDMQTGQTQLMFEELESAFLVE